MRVPGTACVLVLLCALGAAQDPGPIITEEKPAAGSLGLKEAVVAAHGLPNMAILGVHESRKIGVSGVYAATIQSGAVHQGLPAIRGFGDDGIQDPGDPLTFPRTHPGGAGTM